MEAAKKAPVAEWIVMRAFDTAKECEEYSETDRNKQTLDVMAAKAKGDAEYATALAPMADAAMLGRCVPADRVYPKTKP